MSEQDSGYRTPDPDDVPDGTEEPEPIDDEPVAEDDADDAPESFS